MTPKLNYHIRKNREGEKFTDSKRNCHKNTKTQRITKNSFREVLCLSALVAIQNQTNLF